MNVTLVNRLKYVAVLLKYIHQFNPGHLAIMVRPNGASYLLKQEGEACPQFTVYPNGLMDSTHGLNGFKDLRIIEASE